MNKRERNLILGLALYGVAAYGLGYFARWSHEPTATPAAIEDAQSAIRSLRLQVDARADSLEELRAAAARAAKEDSAATAEAERVAEVSEVAIAESEARSDSIASDLRSELDARLMAMVDEIQAENAKVVHRLRDMVRTERTARLKAQARVAILEASVLELEHTVATQVEIIQEWERLDRAREDQVRSLEAQRTGGVLLAIAGVACALLCE